MCQETYLEHGCNVSWVGDGWCDLNCQDIYQCGYDLDDCGNNGCGEQCATLYDVFDTIANDISNDDKIEQSEIDKWFNVGIAFGIFDKDEVANESVLIPMADKNHDQLLNMYEMVVFAREKYGVSLDQALQIDCSACLKSDSANYNT